MYNTLSRDVQMQFMRPGQLEAAARKFPVVYVPFGLIEWHGRHLPLGNDALKADKPISINFLQGTTTPQIYVETKADLFVRHIPTTRLYFAQTAGAKFVPTAGLDRDARAVYKGVLDALEAMFRAGMRKGLFLKADPRMLVLGLEGVSNAFLDELIERPDDFSAETTADLTKTLFFERIRLKAR